MTKTTGLLHIFQFNGLKNVAKDQTIEIIAQTHLLMSPIFNLFLKLDYQALIGERHTFSRKNNVINL